MMKTVITTAMNSMFTITMTATVIPTHPLVVKETMISTVIIIVVLWLEHVRVMKLWIESLNTRRKMVALLNFSFAEPSNNKFA